MSFQQILEQLKQQLLIMKLRLQRKVLKKKVTIPVLPKPRFIIVHHGGGPYSFSQVNKHHTNKWGFISSLGYGIGYQYFIDYSGLVFQGRADNEEGAHTIGNTLGYYNKTSIGICLRGDLTKQPPTTSQLRALKKLIDKKKLEYKIPNNRVKGHLELSQTLCPGKSFRWLVKNYPD